MEKKIGVLLLSTAALFSCVALLLTTTGPTVPIRGFQEQMVLRFDGTNKISSDEISSQTAVRKTARGNNVTLGITGTCSSESGYFIRLKESGASIRNTQAILGMTKIVINSNVNFEDSYKLSVGTADGTYEQEFGYRGTNYKSGWEDTTLTYNVRGGDFFKLEWLGGSTSVYIRSIDVYYSCEVDSDVLASKDLLTNDMFANFSYVSGYADGDPYSKSGGTTANGLKLVPCSTDGRAMADSGYTFKYVAPVNYKEYMGDAPFIFFDKDFDFSSNNLVLLVKAGEKVFPDMKIMLCDGWNAVTKEISLHIGDAWADISSVVSNHYRYVNVPNSLLVSNLSDSKTADDLKNIDMLRIAFDFADRDASNERTCYIDRMLCGKGLYGYSNCQGSAAGEALTTIPLTSDGSAIPENKKVVFEIQPMKCEGTFETHIQVQKDGSACQSLGDQLINGAGQHNLGDQNDGRHAKRLDDGWWEITLDSTMFTSLPNKLVATRWNQSAGLIRNIHLAD